MVFTADTISDIIPYQMTFVKKKIGRK